MNKLPCYIYREGFDFTLPPELKSLRPQICEFAVPESLGQSAPGAAHQDAARQDAARLGTSNLGTSNQGASNQDASDLGKAAPAAEAPRLIPDPALFRRVLNPDEAALFLFPYDIGPYIDSGRLASISALLAALPHLPGRQTRHLVTDHADSTLLPQLSGPPLGLFKTSLRRADAGRAVALWYRLPDHVARDSASFNWEQIRFDCTFHGTYNNPARRAAVLSIQRDAPELLLSLGENPSIEIRDGVFRNPPGSPEERRRKEELFRRAVKASWTVLCPPGMGPQSVRLYESMYLGRIPVLFAGDCALPQEESLDYGAFCALLPLERVMESGRLLAAWLKGKNREELQERCILARKTWQKHFSPEKRGQSLLALAAKKFHWNF